MDWKYIIKRVIIGVLIAFIIMFIKGALITDVSAMTMTASTSCVIYGTSGGGTSSTCQAPPNNHTFTSNDSGFGYNIWWTRPSGILIPNHTYYIKFEVSFNGFRQDGPGPSLQLYTGNDGTASNRAYPDRNEQKSFIKQDTTQYGLVWSFHLDSSGTFNTIRITGYNDAYFGTVAGQTYTTAGIQYGIITVIDITDTSSGSNQDIINNSEANTSEIITNNTQNTTNIINNNNENTQTIINNDNSNTEQIIDSTKVCKDITIDKNSIKTNGFYLSVNNAQVENSQFGITDYLPISNDTKIKVTVGRQGASVSNCFYNSNKEKISCSVLNNLPSVNSYLSLPTGTKFVRFTINNYYNDPQYLFENYCVNGNQEINDSINNLNDSLNDDNTNKEQSDFQDFFDDFNYGDDTLSSVVTAPLRFINSLTDTCTPITINVLGQNVVLPCGDTIFWSRSDVSTFRTFWNILFGGAIIYALALKLYKVIHNAFDPEKDNIETVGVV